MHQSVDKYRRMIVKFPINTLLISVSMNAYLGWVQGLGMPSVYVHLLGMILMMLF